jgi:hypothetical protein
MIWSWYLLLLLLLLLLLCRCPHLPQCFFYVIFAEAAAPSPTAMRIQHTQMAAACTYSGSSNVMFVGTHLRAVHELEPLLLLYSNSCKACCCMPCVVR